MFLCYELKLLTNFWLSVKYFYLISYEQNQILQFF